MINIEGINSACGTNLKSVTRQELEEGLLQEFNNVGYWRFMDTIFAGTCFEWEQYDYEGSGADMDEAISNLFIENACKATGFAKIIERVENGN